MLCIIPSRHWEKHSGTFNWKEHIFPLNTVLKGLYLPLPVLGSVLPASKNIFGSNQDISHPDYELLGTKISELIEELKLELIVVSGHDYGMQYFKDDAHHFILSGKGAEDHELKYSEDAGFADNASGYSILRIYSNEEIWLEFVSVDQNTSKTEVIFRTRLYDDNLVLRFSREYDHLPSIEKKDTLAAASDKYHGEKAKKFWLGELYRDMWTTPVSVPFLNIQEHKGGLIPKKLGGGKSTLSLRLEGPDEGEYVLRSVDKYYYRALGPEYKDLKVFDIVQDMVAANCTYCSLITPYLSRAADIYYTDAKLFYVKHQPGLKGFNEYIPENLYWLEQRPSDDGPLVDHFGYASEIINYIQLMEELENKKSHIVDQKWVLKSRLFDMWIHDLDRHHDNWRWAVFNVGDATMYRPIPRDRDMAFYNFEGVLPGFISHYISRLLLPFRKNLQDVQYFNDAAADFDNTFLNQLDWSDWQPIVSRLQGRLSDTVIVNSISLFPETVQHLVRSFFIENLKYRRDHLEETARRYYEHLNKEVIIVGTNNVDHFFIDLMPSGEVSVKHEIPRKKKASFLRYSRVFDPEVTKDIRIYGMNENDKVVFNGSSSDINIRIIGGHGQDTIINSSSSKDIIYYDYPEDYSVDGIIDTRESEDLYINSYLRKNVEYNTTHWTANFGIAPDDGFWLGIGQVKKMESWPHHPFKTQHKYSLSLAPGSRKFLHLNYDLTFNNIGRSGLDLITKLAIKNPTYLNYFGLGNESNFRKSDKKFNWVRMHHYRMQTGISKSWNQNKISIEGGPFIERRQIKNREGRITSSEEFGFSISDLEARNYVGISGHFNIGYKDQKLNPMDGFVLDIEGGVAKELSSGVVARYFSVTNTVYIPLSRYPQVTFANRIGYAIGGGQMEFYQRPSLGHSNGLRGWRHQRFIGDRAFYHNMDLRWFLFETQNRILPARVNIVGGFDYGRVWIDDEISNKLHTSFSLGFSLDILSLVIIHPYLTILSERNYFSLNVGHKF